MKNLEKNYTIHKFKKVFMTKEGYLPKDQRKKILLLCDDIRVHSGVATVAREMVINTCHRYNWVNLAGAINHPEKGKKLDLSQDTNTNAGIEDSSVTIYPTDGYGNPDLIRQLIKLEKPDALFIITDPRYFDWLFRMENEIRKEIPIVYLNIWDDYPAPAYNKEFYQSCDALFGISKQTVNINKIVLDEYAIDKIIKYVPHGLNEKIFKPINENDSRYQDYIKFKNEVHGGKEIDFTLFFNSRNIRRKQIPDAMLAFRLFLDKLPKEKAKKCCFVLHTAPVDQNGTDLNAVADYLFDEYRENIIFSAGKLDPNQMSYLYNIADATILLSSNEGWGLALTESMLAGTPFIANVTGGMQDQMRFEDEDGEWIEFDEHFPSNNQGTYKKCGGWAFPCFPGSLSIQGSPATPYIWDDRCKPTDATDHIMRLYEMTREERKALGKKGREWATSDEAGLTSVKMSNKIIKGIDELFDTWEPREKFVILKDTDYDKHYKRTLKHALVY